MANLDAVSMIIILFVCMIIALVIGYFIGNLSGRSGNKAALQEKQKHDELKEDVREHFRQTSALMTRMAQDYRDMQQHMSDGAERLAGLQDEKPTATTAPAQVSQSDDGASDAIERQSSTTGSDTTAAAEGADQSEVASQQAADRDRDLTDKVKKTAQEVTEKPASSGTAEDTGPARNAADRSSGNRTDSAPQAKHVQVGSSGAGGRK